MRAYVILRKNAEEVTGAVFNTAVLFGPDGSLLGEQRKVHPYGLEGTADGLDITAAVPPVRQNAFMVAPWLVPNLRIGSGLSGLW